MWLEKAYLDLLERNLQIILMKKGLMKMCLCTPENCGESFCSVCKNWTARPEVKQQHHYAQFKIQPITFITANGLNYSQGNVIKYICRYKDKDGLKDLLKAKNYIDYLIQELETGEVKP